MAETKNHKFVTGVRNFRLAKITADNKDALTIEPVITVAEDLLQKFGVQPESSSEKVWASNKAIGTLNSKNGGKLTVELASLPQELDLAIQGATKDETTGLITYTSEDISPDFAVSAEITYNDGSFAVLGLAKVSFELVSDEADTQEDKAKAQSYKLEGTVLDRINDGWYKTKVYSDETGFDVAKFDTKVFKTATI
ncbi:major tail protein [Macrococcus sp. EM39E]|uniref:major tail protein n=1 Tax=Macrococcus animalis TaxID=3395467 RepID=UPI0039BE346E